MIILSEDNLAGYIKENLADRLDFVTDAEVQNVAVAGGGLVSAVFKAQVDGQRLYFKQAIHSDYRPFRSRSRPIFRQVFPNIRPMVGELSSLIDIYHL